MGNLEDGFIKRNTNEIKNSVEEIDLNIKEGMDHIKEMVDMIQMNESLIDHIQNEKQILDLQGEIIGVRDAAKYSDKDTQEIKDKINDYKDQVRECYKLVDTLILQKIQLGVINDEFTKIQKELNELILRIDPSQLN